MIIYYGVKKRSIPDYLFSRSHAPAWERSSVGIPTPERGNETNFPVWVPVCNLHPMFQLQMILWMLKMFGSRLQTLTRENKVVLSK